MKRFEKRESVVWFFQGKAIFAMLHRPLQEGPRPAVLMCHGLGGTKVGRHRIYVALSEALARLGIAVMRFDFSGCGDSEGDAHHMSFLCWQAEA